jgi:predicted nucleotidyltransferase
MASLKTAPWIHQAVTAAFGTAAKVGVLRALAASGAPISQREAARRARLAHRSAQLAIDDLVAMGLVSRIEGGRDRLVSLNEAHMLASVLQDLFAAEAEFFAALRRELVAIGQQADARGLAALVLFGSVARAQERLDSDLDVLVVGRTQAAADRLLEAYIMGAGRVQERFGARLRPIAYSVQEARRRWHGREVPLPELAQDAVVLHGPPLGELLA